MNSKIINLKTIIIASILVAICIIRVNTNDEINAYSEEDILRISKEIEQSEDRTLKAILENGKYNPNTYKILEESTIYPIELLELASKKSETIDFVADYPNYIDNANEDISIEQEYNPGEIPLFIQWDKRWGYSNYGPDFMAINGCGPTSLAMVAVGLTGDTNINPKVVAEYSDANGYLVDGVGSKWSLMTEGAKEFGIVGTSIPISEYSILNTLEKGQPIIATMAPGNFTTSGHYIVLTGLDSNGKIIVNDSDSKVRSKKTWDIDVFLKEAKNLWSFKKV